jgi:hypothetical protein
MLNIVGGMIKRSNLSLNNFKNFDGVLPYRVEEVCIYQRPGDNAGRIPCRVGQRGLHQPSMFRVM